MARGHPDLPALTEGEKLAASPPLGKGGFEGVSASFAGHCGRVSLACILATFLILTALTSSARAAQDSIPAPIVDITQPSIPTSPSLYPIDLSSALRLAERENPIIGEARARIGEALAIQKRARVEMLPWLNAGVDYNGHVGNVQRSTGAILNLSRQALYIGGGAGTSAQNTLAIPAVSIFEPLADAIYDPLAAHQRVHQARFDAAATANSILLEVTRYYLDLLGATARLEADRRSSIEAEELMRITERYAQTGEGLPSDFHRALAEWRLRRAEVRRTEENVAVAAARLARRLHLDPSIQLRPTATMLEILALVDLNCDLESLVQAAVRQRPEVGAATADLAAHEVRLRQAKARPFLPTVWLGFSGGAFGGGSNLVTPLLGRFAGRTDFDIAAFWTLENLGAGNLLEQKRRRAEMGAAAGRRASAIALVRAEVAAAWGEARAWREQVEIAREGLNIAIEGFRRDLERALEAVPDHQGRAPLPIDVLNSLQLLVEARRRLIRVITEYDRAQFRLFVALGSPPPLEQPSDPAARRVSIDEVSSPVTQTPRARGRP
jgi:outer membrane protein TolC